jgi:hypothetical protein
VHNVLHLEYNYEIVQSLSSQSSNHITLTVAFRRMEEVASSSKTQGLTTASEVAKLAISQMDERMRGPRGLSAATSAVNSSELATDAATSEPVSVAVDAIAPLDTALKYVGKIVQMGDQIAQVCSVDR